MLCSYRSYQCNVRHGGSNLGMGLSAVFHDVSKTLSCLWNVQDLELYFLAGQKVFNVNTSSKPKTNYCWKKKLFFQTKSLHPIKLFV